VSFHQVSEVLGDKSRLSIGGWFHGVSLPRPEKVLLPVESGLSHIDIREDIFFSVINPVYLNPMTQAEIQEKFEASSEICLPDFLNVDKFEKVCEQLKSFGDWQVEGPPNRRNLLTLCNCPAARDVQEVFELFKSEPFFLLLSNLTGLKLHKLAPDDSDDENEPATISTSEENEINPKCVGRVRKFIKGNYTLVRDDDLGQAEFALDARLFFNVSNWDVTMGGHTVYIARDEDEELVSIEPDNNSLNLVYRDRESMRFVKYVNGSATENGPFHDMSFTYYE